MQIAVGDSFPDFASETHDGTTVRLADYRNKQNVVVYFYPRDLTPGCTREAGDFNRRLAEFGALGTAVVGISVDPKEKHARFTAECGLSFPLLTDTGGALSGQLGILRDSGTSERTTFVLDKAGIVRRLFSVKSVGGHVDEVLEAVRSLA